MALGDNKNSSSMISDELQEEIKNLDFNQLKDYGQEFLKMISNEDTFNDDTVNNDDYVKNAFEDVFEFCNKLNGVEPTQNTQELHEKNQDVFEMLSKAIKSLSELEKQNELKLNNINSPSKEVLPTSPEIVNNSKQLTIGAFKETIENIIQEAGSNENLKNYNPDNHMFDRYGNIEIFINNLERKENVGNHDLSNGFQAIRTAISDMIGDYDEENFNYKPEQDDLDALNNLDVFRSNLDEFNKKTNYSYMGDPNMMEVYATLNMAQKLKNVLDQNLIAEQSLDLQTKNKQAFDNVFGNINELNTDVNQLTDLAKKANMIPGELSDNQKAMQDLYIEQLQANNSEIRNNLTLFENEQKNLNPNQKTSQECKTEIDAFNRLAGIAKLENAIQMLNKSGNPDPAKTDALNTRKKVEMNFLAQDAPKNSLGKSILDTAQSLEKTDLTKGGFEKLMTSINLEINKREKSIIVNDSADKTRQVQNKVNDLNQNVVKFMDLNEKTGNKIKGFSNKLEENVKATDDFQNKNPKITALQERAKKMIKDLDQGKRLGHTDSKEYEAMRSTLNAFAEEPSKENYKQMIDAAGKYQQEKKNGFRLRLFTTGMRGQRLQAANDILSLGEQYNSIQTQLDKENTVLQQSKDSLSAIGYSIESKMINSAINNSSDIMKNQEIKKNELAQNVQNLNQIKTQFNKDMKPVVQAPGKQVLNHGKGEIKSGGISI